MTLASACFSQDSDSLFNSVPFFSLDSFPTIEEYNYTGDLNVRQTYDLEIYKNIGIYEDIAGQLSIENLINASEKFTANQTADSINYNSVHWGHIQFKGRSLIDTSYFLMLSDLFFQWDKIELWLIRGDDTREYYQTGQKVKKTEKQIKSLASLFEIFIASNEIVDLYFRFDKLDKQPEFPGSISFTIFHKNYYPGLFEDYDFKGDFTFDPSIEPFQGNIIINHEFYTDIDKNKTVEDISQSWDLLEKTNAFNTKQELDKVYWTKIHLKGNPYLKGEQLFHLSEFEGDDSSGFDYLDYYIFKDGKMLSHQKTGDHISVNKRPYKFWANFIKLDLKENDTVDVFVRLEGSDKRFLCNDMFLFHINPTTIYPKQLYFGLKNGVFFGVLCVQFFFFLILYFIERASIYFYFALLIFGSFLAISTDETNFYSIILFPGFRDFHIPLHYLGLFLGPIGYLKFTEKYFNYSKPNRYSNWIIPLYIIIHAFSCFVASQQAGYVHGASTFSWGHDLVMLAQIIVVIISLSMAWSAADTKGVSKKFFYAAFFPVGFVALFFFSVNFSTTLQQMYPFAYDYLYDIFRVAFILMILLLSLCIGHRTNKLKAENEIAQALAEKNKIILAKSQQNEMLLKEIHHRVKNNLQTISSLLYLQSYSIEDKDAKETIAISQQRVESMALIHKNLYQRDNLSSIEMKDYITKLSYNLENSYGRNNIKIKINMDALELDVDSAVPLGLIINELVTNSYKYAFPNDQEGEINIKMFKDFDNRVILKIQDNGVGKGPSSTDSFGTQLISLLTKQIEGTLTTGNSNGYWSQIVINNE